MTEEQWFAVVDPEVMLGWVAPRGPGRKLRLFACACCRRAARHCRGRFESVLADAEAAADAEARARPRRGGFRVPRLAALWMSADESGLAHALSERSPADAARLAAERAQALAQARGGAGWEERWYQAAFLCDLFGNPFRAPAFDPGWRSETVVQIARGVYDGRDFSGVPILADALQDAGCDAEPLLAHCRDPHGAHVRGCWVVDLVLGKA
jgi:hypothetical protein